MHHWIPLAGIANGGHWPWPWRSVWSFWLRILGNAAYPLDDSSQIGAKITKFAPCMHHGILSAGIENEGHLPLPSRSFWSFGLRILENWAYPPDNSIICNGFELESPHVHQICILVFYQLLLKVGVIDRDLEDHLAISTQETAFSVALVYWSRPANVCYMSQSCSC